MFRSLSPERPRDTARAVPKYFPRHVWRIPILMLSLTMPVHVAWAENLGMELLSTGITPTTIIEEPRDSIDEIVVFGVREQDETEGSLQPLEDPLLQRILRDFEMRQELERDTEHHAEAPGIGSPSPRLRIGYASHEELRKPVDEEPSRLPLDLVKPAIVIELDF